MTESGASVENLLSCWRKEIAITKSVPACLVSATLLLSNSPVSSMAAAGPNSPPGQTDYRTYCAPCHGPLGQGDGPLAGMLTPRPARHDDVAFMGAQSDQYLFGLLKEGGPALGKSALMGTWGRILSEQRIRDLVCFVRTLSAPQSSRDLPNIATAERAAGTKH